MAMDEADFLVFCDLPLIRKKEHGVKVDILVPFISLHSAVSLIHVQIVIHCTSDLDLLGFGTVPSSSQFPFLQLLC